jgi:hypothetical protein
VVAPPSAYIWRVSDLELRAGDDERQATIDRLVGAAGTSALLWVIWLVTDPGGFAWPAIPTAAMLIGVITDLWGGGRRPPVLPPGPPLPPLPRIGAPTPRRRHEHDD